MVPEQEQRLKVSVRDKTLGISCLGLLVLVLLAAVLARHYAVSQRPPAAPALAMPNPNAYDFFVRAGRMVQAIPQAERTRAYSLKTPLGEAADMLPRARPAFQEFRAGLRYECLSPPPPSSEPTPELAMLRELARMLVVEGRVQLARGQSGEAGRTLLDVVRFGARLRRGGALLHALVGSAVESIGMEDLTFAATQIEASQCRALASRLADVEQHRPRLAECLREQHRVMLLDLERTVNTSAPGNGVPAVVSRQMMRVPERAMDGYFRKLISEAARPAYQRRLPRPLLPPLRDLAEVYERCVVLDDAKIARYRLLRTELALHAYALERGRRAVSLADLVPAYLPAVPQDPFAAGQSLRYRSGPRAFAYSVGLDGKDDGGRAVLWRKFEPEVQGDFVVTLGERESRPPSKAVEGRKEVPAEPAP